MMKFYKKERRRFSDEHDIVECTLWEKIVDIYRNVIYFPFIYKYIKLPYDNYLSCFFYRVNKVLHYVPALWQDRDWDSSYMLELLNVKLKRMAVVFENGHLVSADSNLKEVKIALILIDKILHFDYNNEARKEVASRLGKPYRESKMLGDLSYSIKFGNGDIEDYEINRERHHKIRKMIYWKWENKKKEDTKYLFKLMGRKLHNWWD